MEDNLLEGKNAIITGARRGIGRATVEVFAKNGANIWACARVHNNDFETDMAKLAVQYGVWIKPVYCDMADEGEIKEAARSIMKEKLPVNALINVSGITYNALFQMTSMDKLKEQFAVNFFAPFLFTQNIVKLMIRNGGGSIVNIASSAGIDANAGRAAYGSSKAALICLTKVIAEELGVDGVRVNAIAPGIIDTDMAAESMTKDLIDDTISSTMLRSIGIPSNIADAAAFLASEKASYITGQVLRVDGGM